MHELALVSKLARVIVVSISVLALEEHLANGVERMRTAADVMMSSVKIHLLRNCGSSKVVIACVIMYKVTDCTGVDNELLQHLADDFSHLLATMSAR
jgi:hypothetical protein